jgi:hypothetical protein
MAALEKERTDTLRQLALYEQQKPVCLTQDERRLMLTRA